MVILKQKLQSQEEQIRVLRDETAYLLEKLKNKGRDGGFGENFREKMRNRLKMLDRNNDGKISKEEWPGDMERFQQMDRNGDGFLSKEDRQQR